MTGTRQEVKPKPEGIPAAEARIVFIGASLARRNSYVSGSRSGSSALVATSSGSREGTRAPGSGLSGIGGAGGSLRWSTVNEPTAVQGLNEKPSPARARQ